MRLLRGGPALTGHDELDRREAASRAAASTEKGEALQVARFGFTKGGEDVGGVAAGREHDDEVAGLGEARDLAREGLVEAVVVADARHERAIGGQRERWQRTPIFGVAAGELGGEVGGLGGAPAIAADEEFVAGAQRFENERRGGVDRGADRG